MIAVCGDAREPVSMCPGRTGPELGSQLFQLERFCDVCPDFVSGYMQGFKQPFVADPGLLSVHEHPGVDALSLLGCQSFEACW